MNKFIFQNIYLGAELMPDYFVDGAEDFFMQSEGEFKKMSSSSKSSSAGSSSAGGVDELFGQITSLLNEDMTGKVGAVYRFVLKGDQPGNWVVDIKNGPGRSLIFFRKKDKL